VIGFRHLFASFLLCIIPSWAAPPLQVVVTFSILQNLVEEIGGSLVQVKSIVPVNVDPHTYQPSIWDAKNLKNADLIVVNGLGFEGWLDRLIAASGFQGTVIIASNKVVPRTLENQGRTLVVDAHAWHKVDNAILYINTIVDGLSTADPDNAETYQKQGEAFIQRLRSLDREVKALFATIPVGTRKVVTTHDAFWYFGEAYQVEFFSPLGISTEAEASAADVAALIDQIRNQNIRAVFLENLSNKKLIVQIAMEAHVCVDGTLYADSLSEPGGPASTYIAMMRHNARALHRRWRKMPVTDIASNTVDMLTMQSNPCPLIEEYPRYARLSPFFPTSSFPNDCSRAFIPGKVLCIG
jgi:zinc/manganese transport system substrate-binding protein